MANITLKKQVSYETSITYSQYGDGDVYIWKKTLKTITTTGENTEEKQSFTAGISRLKEIETATADGTISATCGEHEFFSIISKSLLNKFTSGEIIFPEITGAILLPGEEMWRIFSDEKWEKEYAIVQIRGFSHDILDANGVPYPKGIPFNYIDGCICERYYNLKELYKYLIANPTRFKNVSPISPIPYYSRHDGHEQTIEFTFIPTREEYKGIYGKSSIVAPWENPSVLAAGIDKFLVK